MPIPIRIPADQTSWTPTDLNTLSDAVVELQTGSSQSAPPQTAVIFGDSVTDQNNGGTDLISPWGSALARGYWTHAQMLLGQRFVLLKNAGVGGNNTTQMLARLQADALVYRPGYFIVSTGGDNDVTQDVPYATTIANLQSIFDRMRATGALVVVTSCLPTSSANTTARQANLLAIAAWIRNYATSTPGLLYCDFFSIMSDPATTGPGAAATTTATGVNALNSATVNVGSTAGFATVGSFMLGGVLTAYTGVTATSFTGCGNHAATTGGETITGSLYAYDGIIHPSQLGAYRMGQALAYTLGSISEPPAPLAGFSNVESSSVLPGVPNPRLVGNTAGVANSVTFPASSGSPTLTKTKVARTDGVQGEWQQVVISGATDAVNVQQPSTQNVGASTTATGVNTLNSATVNVGSTTGFLAAGSFIMGGVVTPYTGVTGTSFTGCGNHAATVGGEAITGNVAVGERVYAVAEVEIDPGATMVGKTGESPVQLLIINQDSAGAPIMAANFAASGDGTYPGPVPNGRLILRTPNFLLAAGTSRLFIRVAFFVNGTVRVGRMQLYKATSTTLYG